MQGRITGLLLSLMVVVGPAFAQDDGRAPQTDRAGTPAADDADGAERDELEPAVSTSAPAADVQRSTRGERVMDEMDLSRSEITGNQELPKVLYIVPWQKADPGELMGKPVNTLLDEVLAPIDRSEFIRQVDYYDDLNGPQEE